MTALSIWLEVEYFQFSDVLIAENLQHVFYSLGCG